MSSRCRLLRGAFALLWIAAGAVVVMSAAAQFIAGGPFRQPMSHSPHSQSENMRSKTAASFWKGSSGGQGGQNWYPPGSPLNGGGGGGWNQQSSNNNMGMWGGSQPQSQQANPVQNLFAGVAAALAGAGIIGSGILGTIASAGVTALFLPVFGIAALFALGSGRAVYGKREVQNGNAKGTFWFFGTR